MKTYNIYIKSHFEAPDYEDYTEADNFESAVDYFLSKLGKYGWERPEIEKHTYCEDECPECHTDLEEKLEEREGGHFERVSYCKNCGLTAT